MKSKKKGSSPENEQVKIKHFAFCTQDGIYHKYHSTKNGWKYKSSSTIFGLGQDLWLSIRMKNPVINFTGPEKVQLPIAVESEDGLKWAESNMQVDYLQLSEDQSTTMFTKLILDSKGSSPTINV